MSSESPSRGPLALLRAFLPRRYRDEIFGDLWDDHQRRLKLGGNRCLSLVRLISDVLVASVTSRWHARRMVSPVGRDERPPALRMHTDRPFWLADELRFATRRILRHPGQTIFSAAVLGLGVAATVLVLVLVRDIVLRPLPFDAPDRLVRLREASEGRCCYWPSFPNFRDWREQADDLFANLAAAAPPEERPVLLMDRSVRALAGGVSRGFFSVLGVTPALGRDFLAGENAPGGGAAAIVSWSFWANELGGRSLDELVVTLGTETFEVVGVLPRDFRFLGYGGAWQDVDLWTPLERAEELGGRTSHGYHVVGRLAEGIGLAPARAEMDRLATRLKQAHGEPTDADQVLVTALLDDVVGPLRRPLRALLVAAVGVLLVACMNLAASLIGQGLGRVREFGVRSALGASRAGLVRQMVVEALLVAVPASAAGLGAAWAGLALLRRETVGVLPRLDQVGIDGVDVGLALGLALGGALAAGLLPAVMAATRFAGTAGTRSSSAGRESQLLWRSFVAGQTALTLTLLVGCGLLLRSFVAAASVDLGYDPSDVLTVDLTLPDGLYQEPDRRIGFYEQALADIRALPGVREVGLTSMQPFETSAMTGTVSRSGAEERVWTAYRYVDAGYFQALRIPVARGEEIRPTEPETPEVVLDAGLAEQLWPDGDALGGALEWPSRVIGIVGSVREWNDERGIGTIYLHWRAFPDQLLHGYLMIRHDGSAAELAPRVRRALAAIDPMVPAEPQPLSGLVRAQLSDRRVLLLVAVAFACLASALAGTGVYVVVAFATSRRRREAAIRLSLGARRGEVGRTMMAQGMRPAFVGILIGLAGAWPVGVALRTQLFQVELLDPAVIAGAGGFLVTVACIAAWIPARRAAHVQPGSALQPE